MAGPSNGLNRLNWSKSRLTDDTLPTLRQKSLKYEEVDFSQNEITSHGLKRVVDICKRCSGLQILKLYKNNIDDDGAHYLADLCRQCPWIAEMHLSHNRLTGQGVRVLVEAATQSRASGSVPLWLRLERNNVQDPDKVLYDLQSTLSVCPRRDEVRCTTRHCCLDRRVHLPHFGMQKKAKEIANDESQNNHASHASANDNYKCTLTPRTAGASNSASGQNGWQQEPQNRDGSWKRRSTGWQGDGLQGHSDGYDDKDRYYDKRGEDYARHRSRSPAKNQGKQWGRTNDSWSTRDVGTDRSQRYGDRRWSEDGYHQDQGHREAPSKYRGGAHQYLEKADVRHYANSAQSDDGRQSRSPSVSDDGCGNDQASDSGARHSSSPDNSAAQGGLELAPVVVVDNNPEKMPPSSMAQPVGLAGCRVSLSSDEEGSFLDDSLDRGSPQRVPRGQSFSRSRSGSPQRNASKAAAPTQAPASTEKSRRSLAQIHGRVQQLRDALKKRDAQLRPPQQASRRRNSSRSASAQRWHWDRRG